jgi:hypothetical protein
MKKKEKFYIQPKTVFTYSAADKQNLQAFSGTIRPTTTGTIVTFVKS